MIIVEGPDGAGKTSLIKLMSRAWDIPVAPRVVSKDAEAVTNMKRWVEDNVLPATPRNMIYDRHRLISGPIYGSLFRRPAAPGFSDPLWMTAMMESFYSCRPLLVFCLPPLETVRANVWKDVTNRVVWDVVDPMYSAYVARASLEVSQSPFSTVIYDYTLEKHKSDPLTCFKPWMSIINQRKALLP